MARTVLDDPPPLTPARLRNFPYQAREFPLRWLLDHSELGTRPAPDPQPPSDDAPNRVE